LKIDPASLATGYRTSFFGNRRVALQGEPMNTGV
jgi:hypothetical protein